MLSPSLSNVAEEFGFSDHERDAKIGGHISLGFFLVGGVCGLFFGSLADCSALTIPRTQLFSIVICIGEMGCIGTYFCTSFTELFVYRVLTGVAIGGSSPVIYKVLGELWGPSQRVRVSTLMGLSSSAGGAIGQIAAGYISPVYGWRSPFLVVAIPALFCALALYFVPETSRWKDNTSNYSEYVEVEVDETDDSERVVNMIEEGKSSPVKGRAVNAIGPASSKVQLVTKPTERSRNSRCIHSLQQLFAISTSNLNEETKKLQEVLASRTALLVYLQGIFGCIPWSILSVFMTDYLSSDLGMNMHRSTLAMLVFGVGAMVGQIAGGFSGQVLFNKDPIYQVLMIATTCILGSVPVLSIVNHDPQKTHELAFFSTFFFGGTLAALLAPTSGRSYKM